MEAMEARGWLQWRRVERWTIEKGASGDLAKTTCFFFFFFFFFFSHLSPSIFFFFFFVKKLFQRKVRNYVFIAPQLSCTPKEGKKKKKKEEKEEKDQ